MLEEFSELMCLYDEGTTTRVEDYRGQSKSRRPITHEGIIGACACTSSRSEPGRCKSAAPEALIVRSDGQHDCGNNTEPKRARHEGGDLGSSSPVPHNSPLDNGTAKDTEMHLPEKMSTA
ncbi:hypothetical protein NX059_012196 [Plenodomus lindquistii]|nr:hypothetical protein NX059_012196 [Plenodomus lindquistii]